MTSAEEVDIVVRIVRERWIAINDREMQRKRRGDAHVSDIIGGHKLRQYKLSITQTDSVSCNGS